MDLSSADQRENPHPTDGFDRVCLAVRVVRGGPARGQRISVEMFLKAGLSRQITLDDLKNPTNFGHDLLKLWPAFKAQFATAGELDEFDATVTKLEKSRIFDTPRRYWHFTNASGLDCSHYGALIQFMAATVPLARE